jgi:hypothetical protein
MVIVPDGGKLLGGLCVNGHRGYQDAEKDRDEALHSK